MSIPDHLPSSPISPRSHHSRRKSLARATSLSRLCPISRHERLTAKASHLLQGLSFRPSHEEPGQKVRGRLVVISHNTLRHHRPEPVEAFSHQLHLKETDCLLPRRSSNHMPLALLMLHPILRTALPNTIVIQICHLFLLRLLPARGAPSGLQSSSMTLAFLSLVHGLPLASDARVTLPSPATVQRPGPKSPRRASVQACPNLDPCSVN